MLLGAVLTPVALTGGTAAGVTGVQLVSALSPGLLDGLVSPVRVDGASPRPQGSAAAAEPDPVTVLVERYDCWSGPAPRDMVDRLPGHVVVTVDGRLLYSKRLVGPALDAVFGARAGSLEVHAFCR